MEPTSSFNVHDGDIIQLYCSFESGYVYGAPNRPGKLDLELDIVHKENIKVADFATFSITLEKKSTQQTSSEVIEKITYGSVVCLKHQASGKFLTANDENEVKLQHESNAKSLFRIISPNHDLAWGEELKDNYSIKLESTFGKNSLVTFDYNHRKKSYKPTLKANINGTVYTIKLYCQEYVKQNPRSIKGGSVINLATLLNIEAYLFGNIDSKIHEDDEDSHEYSLEQPEQDCGDSAQKSQQGKPQLIVGLIKEKRITKFVLSDLNKDNEASLLFEILPTSDPTDCK
uniref:MIR domain-containing protein n=1 Tax=Amphimedon queenslandica TaxID=400682 RepID=A0A1X7TLZ2_AMPQE